MNEPAELECVIRKLCADDPRYAPGAYVFLLEALEYTMSTLGRDRREGAARHVGGRELLGGIRRYATETFGPLAVHVFESFGVRRTEDFGNLVFRLVESGHLSRQESDTFEDFMDGFDFHVAFVRDYRIEMQDVKV